MFDFTDSADPKEIAWWERGPVAAGDRTGGGSWSAYWYHGHIYSSDLGKGFDVLKLTGPEVAKAQGGEIRPAQRPDAADLQHSLQVLNH